ncbi:MarR family winged helix-turn-helix transcriptional regulator [Arthrobacter cryoconiti]|uniref:MarR family winged helix-turn-helix transcriptional regulator n=1 Tax=Arthrobacter cryoconiti TaxID=748907 RepID=A0ABV8R2N5_9MICC|nr:MarR family winged helix-turn-helix transcriptional regulator [Arthrobacter cryoconiti]MCC9067240.1 MarR family winged helix-turn-helix transcriptional regulator [Arthrobacter cryoconiti]
MKQSGSPQRPSSPDESAQSREAIQVLEAQLSLLWRRARVLNHSLTRSVHPELEPAAYGLLSVLLHHGGMRLTELAKCIGVGKPSVSRQIKFLESIGLVQKEADPSDGRAQMIGLTPAGLTKMRSVNAGRQEAFHALLAHWDNTELTTLAVLIAKLNGNADDRNAGAGDSHQASAKLADAAPLSSPQLAQTEDGEQISKTF